MAREISPEPYPREMDMLLSVGERISCALCAMAIHDLGAERDLAVGLAGGDRHRHLAHEGAHPRRAGRPHPRRPRPRATSCSSRASREFRPRATSRPSDGAARTRPRSRSRRRSAPRCARSTPTSTASSPPIRGSCRTRASCRSSRSRRCSRWRPRARACCSCARSSTRGTTGCASTCARASATAPVPSWSGKTRPWNDHS